MTVCSLERRRDSIAAMCDGDGVRDDEGGEKWGSVEGWKEDRERWKEMREQWTTRWTGAGKRQQGRDALR